MKLQEFLQTENKPGYGLRLIVEPGCCAEYTYGLDFAEKPAEGDSVFEENGVKVFVDKDALPLVDGSSIDFEESQKGNGFKINNPKAKHSCGCGRSFGT